MRGSGPTLAVVRQAKGTAWTQARLAEASGLSQGYLSKVESGQAEIEGEALTAVASALEVPVDLLAVRDPHFGTGVSCVHHRRRRSRLTAGSARRVEGLTQLVSLSATRLLEDATSAPEVELPDLPVERFDPAEAAQRVRGEAGLRRNAPVPDVIRLVEAFGIVVVRRDLGTDAQDGVSLRVPGRRPIIVINTALPVDRQRFSVAHEAGHLVLHGWQVSTGEDLVEDEANHFARELLAPESAIRPFLTGLTERDFRPLINLKLHWGVSIAALIEIAKRSGTIDEGTHRAFRMRLNTLGWRLVEPGVLPEENPQLIDTAVDAHLDKLQRSVPTVAGVALMLPEPFEHHYMRHRRAGDSSTAGAVA
ncbi:ImmA/IrrE family metallo-endopeptidase [Actinoplanes flavus]|uniref:ImmA/IrrE family metallo-endopeptidase n=1 Tax=Actinoplanes flavus TaxID=2820290 RepID=A0ABS3UG14_9ACTN|nr:ImmA/IrrE family metallo-endopeptidase [Actinoplanes flavus]MBO3737727.1 ImmA/IrrE family metallo-endopeptidase [Actinoplanes flavus]